MYKIVIDTNVFIAALRSKRGASYRLLFEVNRDKFIQTISSPLLYEYESVAKRKTSNHHLNEKDIDAILDTICNTSLRCKIFFRWRPYLKDPKDDFLLELAVGSRSHYIITYNKKDFVGVDKFGIQLATSKEFLEKINEV